MKITKVEAIPFSLPLKQKYESAAGAHMTPRIIVKIHTDEGVTGIGESAEPFARTWEETPGSIKFAIDKYFAKILVAEDPFNIGKITEAMDKILARNTIAKDVVTTALYDAMGRVTRLPIHKLIGGSTIEKVPIAWCIGYETIEETVRQALKWTKEGVIGIKMKLMDHLGKEIDLEKVKAVREAVGPHMSIRVDANGTLPSIQTLKKMEKYDLALVEQPANDLKGMKKYADALDIPVLVDEYIRGPVEALNIVEQKAADIIAVKDYQVGGIYKAKQIHAMLKPFAAPCYFEATIRSSIGTAASLQLISSEAGTPGSVFGCIAGPLMVEDLVKEPVRFGAGYAEVPTKPGLGVELDEEKLKKLTVTI